MKQQEIIKKIGAIIKELQEQQQYIEQTKGVINDLELELFVANGHFLSDHIEILRKINGQLAKTQAEKKSSPIKEKFFEPVVQPVPVPTAVKKEQPPVEYATFELTDEPIEQLKEDEPVMQEPKKQEEPIVPEPIKEETVTVEREKEQPVKVEEPVAEESAKEESLFTYDEPIIRHELILDEIDEEVEIPGFDDMDRADDAYVYHPEPEHHFTVPGFTPTGVEPVANFDELEPEMPSYAASEPETPSYTAPEPEPYRSWTPPVEAEPETPSYTAPEPEPYRSWTPPVEAEKPPTVYEVITGNFATPNRLADSLPPIKDIKSAINLNDKMLYVRELFHGYSLSYSEAIEILNRCTSFEEADQFLKTNYAQKNDWEDKPATVEKFYGVLRRRFA